VLHLENENTRLKGVVEKMTTINDKQDKEIVALRARVAKYEDNLDYGELLVIAQKVWIPICFDALGIPNAERASIKSFFELDKYIRCNEFGALLYEKLPDGIKDIGGPACFQLVINDEKRIRNKTAHFGLPKDTEKVVQQVKDRFEQNYEIPPSTAQFVAENTPELRAAITVKLVEDAQEDSVYSNKKRRTLVGWRHRMARFLGSKRHHKHPVAPGNGGIAALGMNDTGSVGGEVSTPCRRLFIASPQQGQRVRAFADGTSESRPYQQGHTILPPWVETLPSAVDVNARSHSYRQDVSPRSSVLSPTASTFVPSSTGSRSYVSPTMPGIFASPQSTYGFTPSDYHRGVQGWNSGGSTSDGYLSGTSSGYSSGASGGHRIYGYSARSSWKSGDSPRHLS